MKKQLSITLEETTYNAIKGKDNISKYVDDLIIDSIAKKYRDSIAKQVKDTLMADEEFFSYIVDRLSAGGAAPISAPTPDIKPNPYANAPVAVGYACCKLKNPCKHWFFDGDNSQWKNNITGATRDVL